MSEPSSERPIERLSDEWWDARSPETRARRCRAHRKNGARCAKVAMEAQQVCGTHGGRAPQAKAKARQRLENAADRMARALLGIAEGAESEAVKLAAVKHVLAIGGLSEKTSVDVQVGLKPYEELLQSLSEPLVQYGTKRPAPATPEEPLEIVDAELVPEDTPRSTGEPRTRTDRPDGPIPKFAEPPRPPSRELVTMDEAMEDLRQTRIAQVRRRR
jgi:hypothetical protein